ncbi:oligosaccharide flippase family protein [Acinetobacter towneri]|uniref:lipopolysaccharide biosynthesis protein n=1 Tax=Acinetobacter towneri TaxID=202956 RepID=UPI00188B6018|nr:oligosaccharide flippase family protein [Acinetobacter towneri]MBF4521099.1 oligosaccharide flippase family protein [Acinetobacter towneri]
MLNKKLLSTGSIYLIANMVNASIPFLLLPILTRILSPADYGIIAIFTVLLTLTNAFVGLSVQGAVNVNFFKLSSEKFSEYITSCIFLLILSALGVFVVLSFLGVWLEELLGIPYKWILIAVAISFFQFLTKLQLTVWIVKGEAIKYGILQISNTVLNASLSLIFIFIIGMLWEGRLLGQAVAISIFGLLSTFFLYKQNLFKKPSTLKLDMQDALKFGVPLIPHVMGAFAIYSMDRVIITNFLGTVAVGIYMVGVQLGQAMGLFADSFNKVFSPWLMRTLSNEDIDKLAIVKKTYLSMFFILCIGMIWAILATYLLPYIVGGEFQEAESIIGIICLGFSLQGLYYLVTNYIFFTKKTKFLAIITFISGLINIPLTYMLVKHYGVEGAAYSFLCVQVLFFMSVWYLSAKVYPMPWLFFIKGKKNA